MPRLFVAIDIPFKDQLQDLKTDIPTARWVQPQQMHLTLRFIGADVPDKQVEPIKSALMSVTFAPFELTVAGVGRFPAGQKKPPRVLWVGTQPQPALLELHKIVETALAGVGFPPEDNPFKAHITLARLKAPSSEFDQFLVDHADFHAGTFTVHQFILFSSLLTPQGSRYSHLLERNSTP